MQKYSTLEQLLAEMFVNGEYLAIYLPTTEWKHIQTIPSLVRNNQEIDPNIIYEALQTCFMRKKAFIDSDGLLSTATNPQCVLCNTIWNPFQKTASYIEKYRGEYYCKNCWQEIMMERTFLQFEDLHKLSQNVRSITDGKTEFINPTDVIKGFNFISFKHGGRHYHYSNVNPERVTECDGYKININWGGSTSKTETIVPDFKK